MEDLQIIFDLSAIVRVNLFGVALVIGIVVEGYLLSVSNDGWRG